jgi:hypothetical protein
MWVSLFGITLPLSKSVQLPRTLDGGTTTVQR